MYITDLGRAAGEYEEGRRRSRVERERGAVERDERYIEYVIW